MFDLSSGHLFGTLKCIFNTKIERQEVLLLIEFQNVSKIYRGGKVAVEEINLSFDNILPIIGRITLQ